VLVQRGRIKVDKEFAVWTRDVLADPSVGVAQLTPSAAVTAAGLPGFHGDPADRFIYATAKELAVPLASKDGRISDYAGLRDDVHVMW